MKDTNNNEKFDKQLNENVARMKEQYANDPAQFLVNASISTFEAIKVFKEICEDKKLKNILVKLLHLSIDIDEEETFRNRAISCLMNDYLIPLINEQADIEDLEDIECKDLN